MNGITINGQHSWYNFHAMPAGIEYEYPNRQRVTEQVAFSNVEYDFSALFGSPVYNKRNVKYKFKFAKGDTGENFIGLDRFIAFLYSLEGELEIYDDETPNHCWVGEFYSVKDVSCTGRKYGARMIEVTFRCEPMRRYKPLYAAAEARYPDINGDDAVNATDAQMIETAAANIGAGLPSGLTAEQEVKADANRDGIINASDATPVLSYTAEVGAGKRLDNPDSWADFLTKFKSVEVV